MYKNCDICGTKHQINHSCHNCITAQNVKGLKCPSCKLQQIDEMPLSVYIDGSNHHIAKLYNCKRCGTLFIPAGWNQPDSIKRPKKEDPIKESSSKKKSSGRELLSKEIAHEQLLKKTQGQIKELLKDDSTEIAKSLSAPIEAWTNDKIFAARVTTGLVKDKDFVAIARTNKAQISIVQHGDDNEETLFSLSLLYEDNNYAVYIVETDRNDTHATVKYTIKSKLTSLVVERFIKYPHGISN